MALSPTQIIALKALPDLSKDFIRRLCEMPQKLRDVDVLVEIEHVWKDKKTRAALAMALEHALALVVESERLGIGILGYCDEIFPQALKEATAEDGKTPDPALVIFYKGDLACLNMPSIALIGARNCTQTAKVAGLYLGEQFAKRGLCVVSGLALGCDTSAHLGTLKVADGKTVAVVAHGLHTVFPPQNEGLAKDIVNRGGLLISEYPVGNEANSLTFIERDRLQAALSQACLVIQSGINGGTFHAARTTANTDKPLYVVKYRDLATENDVRNAGNIMMVDEFGAKYLAATSDAFEMKKRLDAIADAVKRRYAA